MIKWKIIQRPGPFSGEWVHAAGVMQIIQCAENVSSICACNNYLPDAGILTEGQN